MTDRVVIETNASPDAAVILLHGLGADGHDFEPIVREMNLPADAAIRFVFPHAPSRPVTINGGMSMPAWFDILGLDRQAQADERGIRESAAYLMTLVQDQRDAGIAASRIFLAGFSQGGAIALFAGLRHAGPLGGIIALSTYLPMTDTVAREHASRQASLPILMVHGTQDPVLPIDLGRDSCQFMQALGYQVSWHEYPMPHSVCMEEIVLLRDWLMSRLSESAS
ncbi:MAG: carboxylesterase [Pseudomonadota bacterium]